MKDRDPQRPPPTKEQTLYERWEAAQAEILALRSALVLAIPREKELRLELLRSIAGTIPDLTRREQQVLQGLRERQQNKEIANDLHVSERTVKFHVSNLLRKAKKTTRRELSEMDG